MVYMPINQRLHAVLLDIKKYNLLNKLVLVFNTSDTMSNCLYHIDHSLGRIGNMKTTLFFKQIQLDILSNNFFWINTLLVHLYRKNRTNQTSQNILHKAPCISSTRFKCLCNPMDIPLYIIFRIIERLLKSLDYIKYNLIHFQRTQDKVLCIDCMKCL